MTEHNEKIQVDSPRAKRQIFLMLQCEYVWLFFVTFGSQNHLIPASVVAKTLEPKFTKDHLHIKEREY